MKDLRWKQRFENYEKALRRLEEAVVAVQKEPDNHLYQMATIQAFEFTIELGWKVLKDYLNFQGVKEVTLPRDTVRQAFQAELITEGQTWIDMLEARNKTSHTYDDAQAAAIVKRIQEQFLGVFQHLQTDFKAKL